MSIKNTDPHGQVLIVFNAKTFDINNIILIDNSTIAIVHIQYCNYIYENCASLTPL